MAGILDEIGQGLVTVMGLAVVAGVFMVPVALMVRRRHRAEGEPLDLREPLPPEGVRVPVVEASAGWGIKGSGAMVLPSDNSLNPLLQIYNDHLECRVIAKRQVSYDQIVRVDGGGAVNAWLAFHLEGDRSFGARLAAADRNAVARFLRGKRIPLAEDLARLVALEAHPRSHG